jgi:hypothetical protein
MINISELQTAIVSDLTLELNGDESFNATVLEQKVKLAILDVYARRDYGNSHYDDKRIINELSTKYYSVITDLARYDYNQMGAEGESSHIENSVSRTYRDRDRLLSSVHAFVKIL